jgi:uncharacterized membrane-anchored protein YitT (DUF2179 family)
MSHTETIDWKRLFSLHNILFTLVGVGCAVFALKAFMLPNKFIDGGVTGVAIVLARSMHIDFSLLIFFLNIPFVYIGFKKIGKTFAVHTLIAITLLSLGLHFIPVIPIEADKILIALFGGFFIGLGIGLSIKSGCVLDGLEVIASYTNKKSGFTTSEIVLFFNVLLILAVAYIFSKEAAMYSILTYVTAMKISDYVADGFEEYTALTVISGKHDAIKSIIVKDFNKAISVFKGERGYLPNSFEVKHEVDIIMTIVTRLEVHRLKMAILQEDPQAFLYVQSIKEVKGGVVKRKVEH